MEEYKILLRFVFSILFFTTTVRISIKSIITSIKDELNRREKIKLFEAKLYLLDGIDSKLEAVTIFDSENEDLFVNSARYKLKILNGKYGS